MSVSGFHIIETGVVRECAMCKYRGTATDHIGQCPHCGWDELQSAPNMIWHPIETAQKDGSEIQVKGGAGPYGVTAWTGSARWGLPPNWHKNDATWLSPDGAVLRLAGYAPTHWMPYPNHRSKPHDL